VGVQGSRARVAPEPPNASQQRLAFGTRQAPGAGCCRRLPSRVALAPRPDAGQVERHLHRAAHDRDLQAAAVAQMHVVLGHQAALLIAAADRPHQRVVVVSGAERQASIELWVDRMVICVTGGRVCDVNLRPGWAQGPIGSYPCAASGSIASGQKLRDERA